MIKFEHINDCVNALEACKTIDEVYDTLDNFPRKFGEWWVDIIPDGDGNPICEVTNQWWDSANEELCENTYELEIRMEDED
jgi:hypothetical protein